VIEVRDSKNEMVKRVKKKNESSMIVTNRLHRMPSLFSKPDKSVQFAQENIILVIDDENQLFANGKLVKSSARADEADWTKGNSNSEMVKKPILKNGPGSIS